MKMKDYIIIPPALTTSPSPCAEQDLSGSGLGSPLLATGPAAMQSVVDRYMQEGRTIII